ncbi:hypothetical protein ACH4GK_10400 [Streptomyces rimosus]|uniref:hypothetical protein n=1 Tax=Streptomyces rimosus TaxID=1927 RepID=UPI00067B047B|nr:hypothetical protein [Streptomyces rimosus]
MKSTRLKARIAGTAAAVAVLGGAALATAPTAAAKANHIWIDRAQLRGGTLSVTVKYSCDPGSEYQLITKMTKADKPGNVANGTVPTNKLVCDAYTRVLKVNLKPAAGSHFKKGDEVKVTADYVKPGEQDDNKPIAEISTVL